MPSPETRREPERMAIRTLERSDLDFAAHLTFKEGWNYTSLEIGRMLELDPGGCFVYEDEVPMGFVTSVTYGRTGVIGHLIVSSSGRGRGIGNSLVSAAIGYMDDAGVDSILVYSTLDGKKIYERFGFSERDDMLCVHIRLERDLLRRPSQECSLITERDLDQVVSIDRELFGDDRTRLIRTLHRDFPQGAFKLEREGSIGGFIFGRPDHIGYDLGPWACLTGAEDDAQALFDTAMASFGEGIVYTGTFHRNEAAVRILGRAKWDNSWTIPLMIRGEPRYTGGIRKVFGPAAFELG